MTKPAIAQGILIAVLLSLGTGGCARTTFVLSQRMPHQSERDMSLCPMSTYIFDTQVTGIETDQRSCVFCSERPPRWRMGGYGASLGPEEMSTLLLIGRFDGTVLRFAILVRPRNTILAVLAMESSQLDNVSTEVKRNRFRLRCTMRCPPGLLFEDFDQTHYGLALGTPARLDVDLSATLDDRSFHRTYARILPAFAANRSPEVQRVLADVQEAIGVEEGTGTGFAGVRAHLDAS